MALNEWCKDNEEVANRFARGLDKGKTKHLFIDKDVIYSYGYHFPIAKKTLINDKVVYLFNKDNYSSSTSRHKSLVFNAVKSYGDILEVNTEFIKALEYDLKDRYSLDNFNKPLKRVINENVGEVKEIESKLKKVRSENKKESYKDRLNYLNYSLEQLKILLERIEKDLIVESL